MKIFRTAIGLLGVALISTLAFTAHAGPPSKKENVEIHIKAVELNSADVSATGIVYRTDIPAAVVTGDKGFRHYLPWSYVLPVNDAKPDNTDINGILSKRRCYPEKQ